MPSDHEGRYHSWGSPAEPYPLAEPYAFRRLSLLAVYDIASSCSEDQEVTMPRSFKVLLPARIRTPLSPEGDPGPLLSWAF